MKRITPFFLAALVALMLACSWGGQTAPAGGGFDVHAPEADYPIIQIVEVDGDPTQPNMQKVLEFSLARFCPVEVNSSGSEIICKPLVKVIPPQGETVTFVADLQATKLGHLESDVTNYQSLSTGVEVDGVKYVVVAIEEMANGVRLYISPAQ